jgi:hypothetical protein
MFGTINYSYIRLIFQTLAKSGDNLIITGGILQPNNVLTSTNSVKKPNGIESVLKNKYVKIAMKKYLLNNLD